MQPYPVQKWSSVYPCFRCLRVLQFPRCHQHCCRPFLLSSMANNSPSGDTGPAAERICHEQRTIVALHPMVAACAQLVDVIAESRTDRSCESRNDPATTGCDWLVCQPASERELVCVVCDGCSSPHVPLPSDTIVETCVVNGQRNMAHWYCILRETHTRVLFCTGVSTH